MLSSSICPEYLKMLRKERSTLTLLCQGKSDIRIEQAGAVRGALVTQLPDIQHPLRAGGWGNAQSLAAWQLLSENRGLKHKGNTNARSGTPSQANTLDWVCSAASRLYTEQSLTARRTKPETGHPVDARRWRNRPSVTASCLSCLHRFVRRQQPTSASLPPLVLRARSRSALFFNS